ncbi:2Fe-2S iron-sulfur cluster-binding protein [Paracoccus sp. (in: a-proteobacteria)]|uniref:2Fe-2S iron-sulfur cluster-binding protein n=2 Tax=Paracoccus TaxID=265 RepID=UPI001E57E9A2|nr:MULTISPECIES: 2Fe-2S iron-sulfur cluster-binding protein [Paracoccus]UFS67488.1 2Fe-2S iron-sulfur cluster-binding protein [Paracoccus denitrificans]
MGAPRRTTERNTVPFITWRDADGTEISANVAAGTNLMRAAVDAGVQGIHGDCGGALACATCHVATDTAWAERLGPPDALEDEMLDMVEGERTPTSRLSCQILARDELEGLVLIVPACG